MIKQSMIRSNFSFNATYGFDLDFLINPFSKVNIAFGQKIVLSDFKFDRFTLQKKIEQECVQKFKYTEPEPAEKQYWGLFGQSCQCHQEFLSWYGP